ncbi:uncharacterized protein Bfra_006381 [Botrytis fragariae]|uniref:Uncharacterized protein n=1 Tax=Botrytis fragariae TaxID=1964551 RepID=A0A8H6B4B1_9HELO|nr:uncharacterized protein Bfra_006381 [Botrytis fragariae]KAF5879176.1 hypothetical protein Bfra_006381 [Botrytis fragariae]
MVEQATDIVTDNFLLDMTSCRPISRTTLSRFSWHNLLKDRVNPDVIPLNNVVLEKYLFAARSVLFLGSHGASVFKPQRLLDPNATTPNHIVV